MVFRVLAFYESLSAGIVKTLNIVYASYFFSINVCDRDEARVVHLLLGLG